MSDNTAESLEFDPYSDVFFNDPYEVYRRLRDEAPVYRNDHYGFYALSRYEDVAAAHRDWRTFTSTQGITIDMLTEPGTGEMLKAARGSIIFMDPPDHDRMRNLVSRVFTPKAVADLEPMIRDLVRKYLDPLDGEEFDIVADFSGPFPVEVISVILGVPEADRQQIRHWTDTMLTRAPGEPKPTAAGIDAALNIGIYIHGLAVEKRQRPADDMLSGLIAAGLSDEEVAGFALLLAGAGSETVTKLIGNGMVLFARNPDQWGKVTADRATHSRDRGDPAVLGAVAVSGSLEHSGNRMARRHDSRRATGIAHHRRGQPRRARVSGSRPFRHRASAQVERRFRSRYSHVPRRGAGAVGEPSRVRRDRESLAQLRSRRSKLSPGEHVERRRIQQRPRAGVVPARVRTRRGTRGISSPMEAGSTTNPRGLALSTGCPPPAG